MKTIILAGGSGTRLWPLSRDRYPKQFIKFQGEKESLFQQIFQRSLMLCTINDVYVVTNEKYKFLVMKEIRELGYEYKDENILFEPEAKGTLPAIYAGVHEILKRGNDSVVVLSSDHMIEKSEEFTSIIKESEDLTTDSIITFGIKPHGLNTAHRYISVGDIKKNGYIINSFKDKPTREKALEYIERGYYWKTGIFMFNLELFENEVRSHAPEIFNAFETSSNLKEAFLNINTKISIDYGIIEKSNKVVMVPVDIGWNRLENFDSFFDVLEQDEHQNITSEKNIIINSTNNLIQSYNEKIIATVGVDDLIIIDNRDALLVCKKGQSHKVKDIVDELENRNDLRKEYHVQDYRPWGSYKVLEEEKDIFKIKTIKVNQGKRLSYQLHHHRSEYWIVVRGVGKVTIDDEVSFVKPGEIIYMKAGQKHRLENLGNTLLEIIEVQMGEYLEEDDIIRFDDEYGRKL